MAANEAKADRADTADVYEQLRELREQVEALMRERVPPILSEAVDQAKDAVRHVGDMAHEQTEPLARQVREKPLTAMLIAVAAGFLLGRITR